MVVNVFFALNKPSSYYHVFLGSPLGRLGGFRSHGGTSEIIQVTEDHDIVSKPVWRRGIPPDFRNTQISIKSPENSHFITSKSLFKIIWLKPSYQPVVILVPLVATYPAPKVAQRRTRSDLASLAPIKTTHLRPPSCAPIFMYINNLLGFTCLFRWHGGDLGFGGGEARGPGEGDVSTSRSFWTTSHARLRWREGRENRRSWRINVQL